MRLVATLLYKEAADNGVSAALPPDGAVGCDACGLGCVENCDLDFSDDYVYMRKNSVSAWVMDISSCFLLWVVVTLEHVCKSDLNKNEWYIPVKLATNMPSTLRNASVCC